MRSPFASTGHATWRARAGRTNHGTDPQEAFHETLFFPLYSALFVAGCQDTSGPTEVDVAEPSFEIIDGTEPAGNPDFFWLPPNVPNPNGDPEFDEDEFDPNFEVIVRICDGTAIVGTECAVQTIDDFTMSTDPAVEIPDGAEHYQVNWKTTGVPGGGSGDLDHRILVIVEGLFEDPLLVGLADVDIVPNGKNNSKGKNKNSPGQEVFIVVSGRTLPIKFRVEANLRCFGQDPCEATVVNLADGGTLAIDLDGDGEDDSGVVFNGGDAGTASPTAAPCEAADIPVDIPVFGDCFTIEVAGLTGDLTNPATVFQCSDLSVEDLATSFGLSDEQLHLLRWHRFDAGDPEEDDLTP